MRVLLLCALNVAWEKLHYILFYTDAQELITHLLVQRSGKNSIDCSVTCSSSEWFMSYPLFNAFLTWKVIWPYVHCETICASDVGARILRCYSDVRQKEGWKVLCPQTYVWCLSDEMWACSMVPTYFHLLLPFGGGGVRRGYNYIWNISLTRLKFSKYRSVTRVFAYV